MNDKLNIDTILFENRPNALNTRRNIIKNNQVQIIGDSRAFQYINYVNIIILREGKPYPFIIDFEDYQFVKNHIWSASKHQSGIYARTYIWSPTEQKKFTIQLHRFILENHGANISGKLVDHKDRNPQNNRKSNLRICDRSQNNLNCRSGRPARSGFRGVHFNKKDNVYVAALSFRGKSYYFGSSKDPVEAALLYNKKAPEIGGEFVILNDI